MPVFERLRLPLATIGTVVALSAGATAGLQVLSATVEARGEVYPYRFQDWLRYLLPSLWPDHGKPMLLLTGPSTVREDVSLEEVAEAFPDYRVFQGALSLGTLADVMASLEYIERAYGPRALPAVLVLGVSPRFVAEIPSGRPFSLGLERYSTAYRVHGRDPTGFGLERKPRLAGMVAGVRFLVRQQRQRYRAAVARLAGDLVGPAASDAFVASAVARFARRSRWLNRSWVSRAAEIGPYTLGVHYSGPYRYRGLPPMTPAQMQRQLDRPGSWWHDVHHWDPGPDSAAIHARMASLVDYCARRGIELYVVNLPDLGLSRQRYAPGVSARYLALVRAGFAAVPFVNLRCLVGDGEFRDTEHVGVAGSRRVTAALITFLRAVRTAPDAGSTAAVAALADAHRCTDLP